MEDTVYKYAEDSWHDEHNLIVVNPIDVTVDYGRPSNPQVIYMTRVCLYNPATESKTTYVFSLRKAGNFDEFPVELKQETIEKSRDCCMRRYGLVLDFLERHREFSQLQIDSYLMNLGFSKFINSNGDK